MALKDGFGSVLDRKTACVDPDASVVITIVDACPCSYPVQWGRRGEGWRLQAGLCRTLGTAPLCSPAVRTPLQPANDSPDSAPAGQLLLQQAVVLRGHGELQARSMVFCLAAALQIWDRAAGAHLAWPDNLLPHFRSQCPPAGAL